MATSSLKSLALLIILSRAVGTQASTDTTQKSVAGYQPQNDVVDLLSIDMDQEAMEARLSANSDAGLEDALKLYTQGAHSLSIATVKLSLPLKKDFKAGTEVVGENDYNHVINGVIYEDAFIGGKILKIKYPVMKNTTKICRVGALSVGDQVLNGCFTRNDALDVPSTGDTLSYTYDPYADNDNGRTLQSFSLDAKRKFYECDENCPYPTFLKFREYYGTSNYADEWIMAAFDGRQTELANGQANFELHSLVARAEAIKKGTSHLAIWMYVVGLLDEASISCQSSCTDCNAPAVRAWDEAVALYVGSLEGANGSGTGLFLYELANERCTKFRTCGNSRNDAAGTSAVNLEIISLFQSGQLDITYGRCDAANIHKQRIAHLMTVPLIQGALYYAYVKDRQGAVEKEGADAALFAASILPLIHSCEPADATTLWENMAIGTASANFVTVKTLLERNYACLAVTCVDVGGIYDSTSQTYYQDASPCIGESAGSNSSTSAVNVGMFAGVVVGVVVALLLLTCCCLPLRRRKIMKRGKEMPSLEVSQAQQELEYQHQLDQEYQRQLAEVERRENSKSPQKLGASGDDPLDDDDMEAVTLMPSKTVKSLVTVFDNSLV